MTTYTKSQKIGLSLYLQEINRSNLPKDTKAYILNIIKAYFQFKDNEWNRLLLE